MEKPSAASSRLMTGGALAVTAMISVWGALDPHGLADIASDIVGTTFASRGWFIMLTVSGLLFGCIWLAASPAGKIRLGQDSDTPEFSMTAWVSMLFSAGMGVGLLFWGTAEPISHFIAVSGALPEAEAAMTALVLTHFHWGLHAWAIYASVGLVIAYFSFRRQQPTLLSAPFIDVFGDEKWARIVGWLADFLAIVAIAIGLGGSVAMGVFQVRDGLVSVLGVSSGLGLTLTVFAVLVLCYLPALVVNLDRGMAILSKAAMGLCIGLLAYVAILGPTGFLMGTTLSAAGEYLWQAIPQGFRTFTLYDGAEDWFHTWTLNYMVWWLAWAPFVGVFIARISRGRTIREFVSVVIIAPTLFSLLWFGVFGSIGFFGILEGDTRIETIVQEQVGETTFAVLRALPLAGITQVATIIAAFLFVITSVVSAALVLAMFSSGGDPDPSVRTKLMWGAVLAALSFVMILTDDIYSVRSLIALGALPFVYIAVLLFICLIRALRRPQP